MISKNNKKSTPNVYTMPFATPAVGMLFMKHGGQQELIDQNPNHVSASEFIAAPRDPAGSLLFGASRPCQPRDPSARAGFT